jgi:DNA-binding MarR family transcriptional regulator
MIGLTEKGRKIIEVLNKQRAERFKAFINAINLTDDEEQVILDVFNRAIKFFDERLGIRTVASK